MSKRKATRTRPGPCCTWVFDAARRLPGPGGGWGKGKPVSQPESSLHHRAPGPREHPCWAISIRSLQEAGAPWRSGWVHSSAGDSGIAGAGPPRGPRRARLCGQARQGQGARVWSGGAGGRGGDLTSPSSSPRTLPPPPLRARPPRPSPAPPPPRRCRRSIGIGTGFADVLGRRVRARRARRLGGQPERRHGAGKAALPVLWHPPRLRPSALPPQPCPGAFLAAVTGGAAGAPPMPGTRLGTPGTVVGQGKEAEECQSPTGEGCLGGAQNALLGRGTGRGEDGQAGSVQAGGDEVGMAL
jgi:hypothetical protein